MNTVNDPNEEWRQDANLKDKENNARFNPKEAQMSNRAKAAMKMGFKGNTNKKGDSIKIDS